MRAISKSEYDELLARSEVVEQDRRGEKVIHLPDGNFMKTFWYRYRVSSRRIYPEWLRFSLHARSLKLRHIHTITVVECVRIPHLKRTAVIYSPLEGRSLRQIAEEGMQQGVTCSVEDQKAAGVAGFAGALCDQFLGEVEVELAQSHENTGSGRQDDGGGVTTRPV